MRMNNSQPHLEQSFSVESRPGDGHRKFIDHVHKDLCANNQVLLDYLLNWIALAIQKPAAPGRVAVVLRGRDGTGKGFVANTFGSLFGRGYWAVSDAKHLVGTFNAHLRDCVMMFVDVFEGFEGDKRHERVLKMLLTEDTIVIERKGVDAEVAPNCVHMIMASNEQWVVPVSYLERRFFVLDVSAAHIQDTEYFGALNSDLKAGGLSNLLHELQLRDLSNFNVRAVPRAETLLDRKVISRTRTDPPST